MHLTIQQISSKLVLLFMNSSVMRRIRPDGRFVNSPKRKKTAYGRFTLVNSRIPQTRIFFDSVETNKCSGGGRKASSLQARDYLDRIEKETLKEIPKNKQETPRVILSDNALQILIKQKRLVQTNDNPDTYVPTMAMYN